MGSFVDLKPSETIAEGALVVEAGMLVPAELEGAHLPGAGPTLAGSSELGGPSVGPFLEVGIQENAPVGLEVEAVREASLLGAELTLETVARGTALGAKPPSVPSPSVASDHLSFVEVTAEQGEPPGLSTSGDLACCPNATFAQVPGDVDSFDKLVAQLHGNFHRG